MHDSLLLILIIKDHNSLQLQVQLSVKLVYKLYSISSLCDKSPEIVRLSIVFHQLTRSLTLVNIILLEQLTFCKVLAP